MDSFNGMVQLRVPEHIRDPLLSLVPRDRENTLGPEQRAHHITLAFKPKKRDADRLLRQYSAGAEFLAGEVRSNPDITALFGQLFIGGSKVADGHITLAGVVPPVRANTLTEEDTLPGHNSVSFHVSLRVVKFGD